MIVPQVQRAVSDAVLSCEWGRGWELVGSRCGDCGEVAFGERDPWCARCGGGSTQRLALPRRGRLWSYTIVRHRPPGPCHLPEPFSRLAVGLVELLDAHVRVLAPVDVDPERLVIGMELALDTPVLHSDDDGTEVVAFRFVEVRSG